MTITLLAGEYFGSLAPAPVETKNTGNYDLRKEQNAS